MTGSQLHVAFLWHMHQPYYKDPITGSYKLPWVRLHGVKDYLDMASILREFPAVKQTFNLVPSLLEQLADYEDPGVSETFLDAARKPAMALSEADKRFLLENFFFANWDTMIGPLPRYRELLEKRGLRASEDEIKSALRYFTHSDFLDLQVLFNLAWIDPSLRDETILELARKGRGFTEDDKKIVIDRHFEIIGNILPTYRQMSTSGQIELSASPYFHPILPLLADTDSAKAALPDIKLPKRRFRQAEDARVQIRMALDYFEQKFGIRPKGMWPSEGSVSEEVMAIFREEGVSWAATDEEVLAASLGRPLRDKSGMVSDPGVLYKAYNYSGVNILFRDHGISDLIGFVYSGMPAHEAARNLIDNLLAIRKSLPANNNCIVPIILDGENAWEYYKNDGRDFLMHLYEGISKEERLKAVTISEHLEKHPEAEPLSRLHAGSWIYANFRTWIGHEEDNLAWDYLSETREELVRFAEARPGADLSPAWRSIYVAEGSDWNWWYGDEHVSETQKEFDELYRANLLSVFREIGKEPPQYLYVPILAEDRAVAPKTIIRGFITPRLDGLVTSYFEWYQAASMSVGKTGGSMHKSESLLSDIYYGFDADALYVRVDPKIPYKDFPRDLTLSVMFLRPKEYRLDISITDKPLAELLVKSGTGWRSVSGAESAIADILEASVPFKLIEANAGDELHFCVLVSKDSVEVERCPWRGVISITVPTADFEARMWY